jgi:hypothetical protein
VYEDAVGLFQPYTHIQDSNPEARDSMRVLIGRARENKQFLFLFVNNRLEGKCAHDHPIAFRIWWIGVSGEFVPLIF